MSTKEAKAKARPEEIVVTTQDILFDCPACGKSLVVDGTAEGMILDCPQCRTNVIVPPRSGNTEPPPADARAVSAHEDSKPVEVAKHERADAPPAKRVTVLMGQLKEIQAQRGEVTGRIAARLNEVNRDLVMLARLETSQQQILSEWNQLVEKAVAALHASEIDSARPVIVGSSVEKGTPARISFGA